MNFKKEGLPVIAGILLFVLLGFGVKYILNKIEVKGYDKNGTYIGRLDKQGDAIDCDILDGEHEATVKYYNPETGKRSTYTLNVEVEDCDVTVIHFPKGGWLDDTHIKPGELDSDGNVTIKDDRDRNFYVHISKDNQ